MRPALSYIPPGGFCAEIGVFRGANAARILRAGAGHLHLVDPWQFLPDRPELWMGQLTGGQPEADEMYRRVVSRFRSSPVTIHRRQSTAAASEFPDGRLDWVYLDGDHSCIGVSEDLRAWFPKVRPGGYLCGHDYRRMPTVARAVDDFRRLHAGLISTVELGIDFILRRLP